MKHSKSFIRLAPGVVFQEFTYIPSKDQKPMYTIEDYNPWLPPEKKDKPNRIKDHFDGTTEFCIIHESNNAELWTCMGNNMPALQLGYHAIQKKLVYRNGEYSQLLAAKWIRIQKKYPTYKEFISKETNEIALSIKSNGAGRPSVSKKVSTIKVAFKSKATKVDVKKRVAV